jgi:RNA polymerase primary sigma factor
LNHLPPREKLIVQLRFGLPSKKPESLELVGKRLKISRERVRQLEERAIKRLKSIALRMRLIDNEESKRLLLDSRKENDRRSGEDRRRGLPDKRKNKIERRKARNDRRKGDRRK